MIMLFLLFAILGGTLIKYTDAKPYSFILMIYGIILGIIHNYITDTEFTNSINFWINMHPHTFLFIFLPPLIYESSFLIDYHIFKKLVRTILTLAISGVIFTFLFSSGFFYLIDAELNNKYSLILGSILSATDPIAVVAILQELKLSHKLSILIEGESLLNDGITIVVYNTVINTLLKDNSITTTTLDVFRLLFGGIIIGFIASIIKVYWLKKT